MKLQGEAWLRSPQKRAVDLAIVGALAMPALITSGLLAGAVGVADRHSPLFSQRRIGMDGVTFDLYKIRSMPPHVPSDASAGVTGVRGSGDHRATRLGSLLRKSHVDELPQMLNIAKGDMSFIGVRPVMPDDVGYMKRILDPAGYARWLDAYTAGRPGYVSSAQLIDRTGPSLDPEAYFRLRAEQDVVDVRSASPRYDIELAGNVSELARTKLADFLITTSV